MNKPEDIKALDKKIQDFKKREKIENQDVSDEPEYSSAAAGFQISTELLAGIVIGLSMGYVLDKFFNTAPWLLAIFTIFGGAAGVLNIYKTFKVDDKS